MNLKRGVAQHIIRPNSTNVGSVIIKLVGYVHISTLNISGKISLNQPLGGITNGKMGTVYDYNKTCGIC